LIGFKSRVGWVDSDPPVVQRTISLWLKAGTHMSTVCEAREVRTSAAPAAGRSTRVSE